MKALQKHTPTGALRFSVPDGGLFLWCRLAGDVSARDVQERALNDSVFIVTGEPFYVDGGGARELRICFTTKPPEIAAQAARVIADERDCGDATGDARRADQSHRVTDRYVTWTPWRYRGLRHEGTGTRRHVTKTKLDASASRRVCELCELCVDKISLRSLRPVRRCSNASIGLVR